MVADGLYMGKGDDVEIWKKREGYRVIEVQGRGFSRDGVDERKQEREIGVLYTWVMLTSYYYYYYYTNLFSILIGMKDGAA